MPGHIRLTDFGLSKAFLSWQSSSAEENLTQSALFQSFVGLGHSMAQLFS